MSTTTDVSVQLIRNATILVDVGDTTFLVDPIFASPGENPPVPNTPNDRRNPLVPMPAVDLSYDAVVVTHRHPDHWDEAAIEELEAEVERKDERIEELEAQREYDPIEIKSDDDTAGLTDIWVAGIQLGSILQNTTENADQAHSRLDDVEEAASNNGASGVETDKPESHDTQTPLERICTLPEHVADRELTTNQKRARFIARDVQDYAKTAPAGVVLDNQTIAKVITATEGMKPHTQTVARVMDFLEKLGKDEVEQTKRRGKKLVVVDEEAADSYHDRCDRANEQAPAESVMS